MEISRRNVLRGTMLGSGGLLAATALPAMLPSASARAADAVHRKATRPAQFAPIDTALQQAVNDGTVANVVAVGATADGHVYEGAYGIANDQAATPPTLDTVFWMLSMTKAITATACMQLVEQGRLHPDQPAADILQELAAPQVLEGFDAAGKPRLRPAKRPITVRHLLTHTSGYTYSIWSEALTRYQKVTGLPDIATCRNAAFAAPLEFDPGERWQYGISMDWIGKLVEAVSDQSLEIYFRENIFQPLGMQNSGFLIGSAQKRRVAAFHIRQADGSLKPAPFEMPQRPEFFMGGGGTFGTPRDYMTFLRALLNGGSLNGNRILRAETVKTMMTNQIGDLDVRLMPTAQPVYSNSFDQFPAQRHKWGFSFDINEQQGPNGRSAGSVSWGGLLNTYFWVDPVKQVAGGFFTQSLPFFDERVVALYGTFERGLYRGLTPA
ncbi:MAG TPA: serine hydrolase domain-containing protein [Dongiaceae bacterium]|nr:serine hydrolase domain-containing protein [Dongiaceae bacterium]